MKTWQWLALAGVGALVAFSVLKTSANTNGRGTHASPFTSYAAAWSNAGSHRGTTFYYLDNGVINSVTRE